jgi:hypothetical protein
MVGKDLYKSKKLLPCVCTVFVILLFFSSCLSGPDTIPHLFHPEEYPNELYYVGSATVLSSEKGIAKEYAKKQALHDLASQIQTRVSSHSTSTLFDDGSHLSGSMGIYISEELTQEIENLRYIEEVYHPKTGQTTHAILSKDVWEGQKLRKTLDAKQKADEILSSRYPDMQKALEVSILKRAMESLNSTFWGTFVEGMIDGKYGQYYTIIETRRNSLLDQLIHSPYTYVSEAISELSLLDAKKIALENLAEAMKTEMVNEYKTSWIQAKGLIDQENFMIQIDDYINFHLLELFDQISVFEGKDSQIGFYQQFVTISKETWQQIQTEDKEKLKNQVEKELSSITENENFNEIMQTLHRARDIVCQNFLGPSVCKYEHSAQVNYLHEIQGQIVAYFKTTGLEIQAAKEIEEGGYLTVTVHSLWGGKSLVFMPVIVSVSSLNEKTPFYTMTKTLDIHNSASFTFQVPKQSETKNLTLSASLAEYPEIKATSLVKIIPIPWINKIKSFLFGKNK